ncbi:D-isomer specific 2-hydroxyacid dehydrogenase NAD-binding [Petrotoga mobilis SJ95]|jgi:D-3-phosphoglycerate dehydrogenase|uniref:D-isomer specific 2-hydroxyacid dehydrogenase NAD-binding n=3 Tax=Petrotoga TaxID=28236 RepID=A9BJ57_PETMO|nr:MULTISPECIES: D-2-hydroxyacid dehydrogenase [Petrotoga]ABX31002.1 D-isomer specific 2-hydroxyacid dehydrogenase NAD-binding [Petrotoga mobilis SJ95]PNR95106.1 2-hydroxyacid dehydrogenase [Petrotoga olearia DSM 13574]RMA72842.1 D-3-phosphoglycerate dehydrogenase [Petrotoga olearia]
MKIHINDPLDENALKKLQNELPDLEITSEHLEKDVLKDKIKEIDVLIVRSATKVTKEILEHADKLKIVARAGMGLDNIDVDTAKLKGITVLNTPGQNSLSVAELVIGMVLDIYRHITRGTIGLKNEQWEKKQLEGFELSQKTFGIIGFGYVGKNLAQLLKGFQTNTLVYDVFEISAEEQKNYNVRQVSLEELLQNSDIISLHIPKNEKTYHFISEPQIKMMKDGAVIINAARGGVLDENYVLKYLKNGKLLGVGLDVFEEEPPKGDFYKELFALPNVVLTPHIGASTKEAQERVGINIVDRVVEEVKKLN